MKILVLNGPNLNFLGIREPAIYGSQTYDNLIAKINAHCEEKGIEVQCLQSNHEGTLIDYIQQAYFDKVDGIVINPGGYTHTSVAILDALKAVSIPTVEVHISKVDERESFRQISYVSYYASKTIIGKGLDGAETGGSFVKVGGELFFLCGNDFNKRADYRIYHKDGMTNAKFDYDDGGFRGWGTLIPIKMGSRTRYFWLTFDRQNGSSYNWSYGNLYCFES